MNFREYYFVEKFGMESIYSLPEDKEQQLFDFYALSLINPNALMDEEAQMFFNEAKETVINGLQKSFIGALYTAVAAELFHTQAQAIPFYKAKWGSSKQRINAINKIEKIFTPEEIKLVEDMRNFGLKSYDKRANFLKEKGYTPEKLYKLGQKIFGLSWSSGYGGKKWKQIADALERLINATSPGEKMVAIDHAYDLQHNNDTVFNKVKEFAKHGSYSWLKRALDLKAKIKEPHIYLQNISAQLYRPLAYALKQIYGKTLEDFIRQKEEQKQKIIDDILKNWPENESQKGVDQSAKFRSVQDNAPVSIFIKYDFDEHKIIDDSFVSHLRDNLLKSYKNSDDYIEIKIINPKDAKKEILEKAKLAREKSDDYNEQIEVTQQDAEQTKMEYIIYYDPLEKYENFGHTGRKNLRSEYQRSKPGDMIYDRYVLMAIIKSDGSVDEL